MGGGLSVRTRAAWIVIAGIGLAGSAGASPAEAITKGQPDEGRHPYVGALVTHDGRDRKKRLICTGTLVSSTVFVTAAHCLVDEPSRLYVSFDEWVGAPDVGPEVRLHPGTATKHPEYVDSTLPGDTHDVGVVKLDSPVAGVTPGELPAPDALTIRQRAGTLASTSYELVGYGREGKDRRGFFGGGGRRFAFGGFRALEAFKLVTDQTGTFGGTCNGDSGGPVLLGSTRTVLSVVSDGDPDCADHGINYRLDTDSAREFLDDFVALPPPGSSPSPNAPGPRPRSDAGPAEPTTGPSGGPFEPAVTTVHARFAASGRGARVRAMRASHLAPGTTATLRCRPARRGACPFGVRRYSGRQNLDLRRPFGGSRLRVGSRIQLRLAATGRTTRIVTWRVRKGRVARTDACGRPVSVGSTGC